MVNGGGVFTISPTTAYGVACSECHAVYVLRPQVDETFSLVVDDLSALVRQLAHRLSKAAPDSDLPTKALDYLKRKGLQGSPLRSADRQ